MNASQAARALSLSFLLALCSSPLFSQAPDESAEGNPPDKPLSEMEQRYTRANQWQNPEENRWLLNQLVIPNWIQGKDAFWYQRETAQGHEYWWVDASNATRQILFDHSALAAELARQLDWEIDARELPLERLVVSPEMDELSFFALGKSWQYRISENLLEEQAIANPATDPVLLVSPDGKQAAFLKEHNIWIRNLESGEERQLSKDGEALFAYGTVPAATGRPAMKPEAIWSPDSSRLLTIQTDDRKVLDLPMIRFAPEDGSIRPQAWGVRTPLPGDENITTFRMTTFDIASGKQIAAHYPDVPAVRMNDTPMGGNRAWWSDDNKTVWFVDIHRGEKLAQVIEFNTDTGVTRELFSESAPDSYVELGSNVYLPSTLLVLPETRELVWYSERSGWAHLYLYDLDTGKLKRPLTKGDWLVRDLVGVDAQSRELFFTLAERDKNVDPYYQQVAKVNLDSGKITWLSASDADHFVPSPRSFRVFIQSYINGSDPALVSGMAPSGNFFLETVQRIDSPAQTVLRDRTGKQVMVVEAADDSRVPAGFQWPERVEVTAADGSTRISGVLIKPANFSADKTYPIIDFVYGGPQVSWVPESITESTYISAASVAELGFFVVMLDGRGTTERSRKFHESSYGAAHTASNAEDHIAGIKQLAERFPQIDLDRAGIFGFSGGGYMTANAMLRFPDFFKVGVSGAGNHDQRLFWHSWGERYQGMLDGDNYLPQANLTYAGNLKGDLLFIHGLQDYGVHPAALFQLMQALMEKNKDFDLVLLPQAGHELPGYGLRRQWDYFVSRLAGETPPKGFEVKASTDYFKEKMKAKAELVSKLAARKKSAYGTPVVVVIETSVGEIEVEVYPEVAPESAGSFLDYVDQGLYSGGAFYRTVRKDNDRGTPVIEVIQGGLIEASNALEPVAHESTEQTGILHTDGTLSLARGEAGTGSGAAFFITIGDQPGLDFGAERNADRLGFAAFGRVVSGMDVVHQIHQSESTAATESDYLEGQILNSPVLIERAYRKEAREQGD